MSEVIFRTGTVTHWVIITQRINLTRLTTSATIRDHEETMYGTGREPKTTAANGSIKRPELTPSDIEPRLYDTKGPIQIRVSPRSRIERRTYLPKSPNRSFFLFGDSSVPDDFSMQFNQHRSRSNTKPPNSSTCFICRLRVFNFDGKDPLSRHIQQKGS